MMQMKPLTSRETHPHPHLHPFNFSLSRRAALLSRCGGLSEAFALACCFGRTLRSTWLSAAMGFGRARRLCRSSPRRRCCRARVFIGDAYEKRRRVRILSTVSDLLRLRVRTTATNCARVARGKSYSRSGS